MGDLKYWIADNKAEFEAKNAEISTYLNTNREYANYEHCSAPDGTAYMPVLDYVKEIFTDTIDSLPSKFIKQINKK